MIQDAIILWNPWWASGKVDRDLLGIRRSQMDTINDLLDSKHIKDIVGVRRCGKTTLLYQIIDDLLSKGTDPKQILLLNFDDISFVQHDLDDILQSAKEVHPDVKYLFLDEVQEKQDWERWVRRLYDLNMFKQIFITGSSASVLSEDIGRVLSGRHITTDLYPFSFKEYLSFNGWERFDHDFLKANVSKLKSHLHRYLVGGGFPEAILHEKGKRKMIHTNLFNDIVTRDVVARYNIRKDISSQLAYYLLTNVCAEYSLRKISNSLNISVDTVSKYLEHLKESELVDSLNLFSYKLKHQFKQNKKIYCIDTGLVDSISFMGHEFTKLMENAVFLELKRREQEIYYFKDKSHREVDFVVRGRDLKLFQVTYDEPTIGIKDREVRSLIVGMNTLGTTRGYIITYNRSGHEKHNGNDIEYIPLWKFLLSVS